MLTGQNLETLIKKYENLIAEVSMVKAEILKRLIFWQSMADLGFTSEAVNTYRKQYNCSIKEALDAVRTFQNKK